MPTSHTEMQDGGHVDGQVAGPMNHELFGDTALGVRPPDEGENYDLADRWACTDG